MANTDNGGQVITFRFQQEGTAEGFNKLLKGVIPSGIISGGELTKINDSTISISKLQMMIGDNNVIVHVQTTENATVSVSYQQPYVIATFNWANLANNFVTFEQSALNTLPSNQTALILGKCEFNGPNDLTGFDYTRKTWSSTYYNNDFLFDNSYRTKSPSFNVTPLEGVSNTIGFIVGVGKAIINGKTVTVNSDISVYLSNDSSTASDYNYINTYIAYKRIDIAVLMDDGTVRYIMGEDSENPVPPKYPSNGLVLAEFLYTQNITTNKGILGSNITNIYNNNYKGFAPTIGKQVKGTLVNTHTLYL